MSENRNVWRERAAQEMTSTEEVLHEVSSSVAVLRTESDRVRGLFGFGRRIFVPSDEIHVVVGDGSHVSRASRQRGVFGQTGDRPSRYWINPLTQVIKLKTISFTVSIRGTANEGVEALDSSKVSFRLWAHAVAKLNPEKAEVAAQRVGLDTTSLVKTVTQVGISALVEAAATMTLEEAIANRNKLADIAFPKVNQTLEELGYDLALLTITKLDGMAYKKLIDQAEARISKETTITTNREQLAELQDKQARERMVSEIDAETQEKLASEQLAAQEKIETATLQQQETLTVRRHEVELHRIERTRIQAEADHKTVLAKLQLDQQIGQAQAEKEAKLAHLKAEQTAELRVEDQKRQASLQLAQSQADAERAAYELERELERSAQQTEAQTKLLQAKELADAQRAKEIALLEATQLAESIAVEAESAANATQIKADAEANAASKQAEAAKIRAEATRAEAAAAGLAEAEVEAAQVEVSEKRVAVARAEAEAEVNRLRQLKEVEIDTQNRLMTLYEEAPVLVELEKIRMDYAHQEKITTMQTDAYLKAFEAIAPGVKIHIYGNGAQTGRIMTDVMTLAQGMTHLGDEIPAVGRLLNGNSHQGDGQLNGNSDFRATLIRFLPHCQALLAEMSPRMISGLKVSDMVEKLTPVVAGDETLLSALNQLKGDATFRMVSDMPFAPLLNSLGLGAGQTE